jgi:sec-independent protein translocase protein TatB
MELGPGIGMLEWVMIGIIALVVVGPKDLPLMFRRAGQMVGKLRGMAADFRSSFDEMARQSELDELRQELNALKAQTRAPLTPLPPPPRPPHMDPPVPEALPLPEATASQAAPAGPPPVKPGEPA